jgi:hypothetical protein
MVKQSKGKQSFPNKSWTDQTIARLTMADTQTLADTQTFEFDIKIIKFSGSISKSGKLTVDGYIFGVQIGHSDVDLATGEFCANPQVGGLAGIQYCFYLKDNCLYTHGHINGWFKELAHWDQQIMCF